jgi:tRNA(Arg) A34 adenosine deaminase TadA
MSAAPLPSRADIRLPTWLEMWPLPAAPVSDEAAMRLALAIARENVARREGGPFGAVLRSDVDGRIISLGVNLVPVTGMAPLHGEIVAILMAGKELAPNSATLFSSSEPCIMCLGASHWASVTRIVSGALRADAEAIGFIEGEGCEALGAQMAARGVKFDAGLLRAEAVEVFRLYAEGGGPIYGPKRG